MIERAIYAMLTASAAVLNAVAQQDGNAAIYPDQKPEAAPLPAIMYELAGGDSEQSLDGISGLAYGRVTVTLYTAEKDEQVSLREQVRLAMQAKSGTYGGVVVKNVLYDDFVTSYDAAAKQWMCAMSFDVWITEATS